MTTNPTLVENSKQLLCHGGGGVDDADVRAGDALDDGEEEGVVGAAEDDGVGAGVQQRLQAGADDALGLGAVQLAALDQLHEALADVLLDAWSLPD